MDSPERRLAVRERSPSVQDRALAVQTGHSQSEARRMGSARAMGTRRCRQSEARGRQSARWSASSPECGVWAVGCERGGGTGGRRHWGRWGGGGKSTGYARRRQGDQSPFVAARVRRRQGPAAGAPTARLPARSQLARRRRRGAGAHAGGVVGGGHVQGGVDPEEAVRPQAGGWGWGLGRVGLGWDWDGVGLGRGAAQRGGFGFVESSVGAGLACGGGGRACMRPCMRPLCRPSQPLLLPPQPPHLNPTASQGMTG